MKTGGHDNPPSSLQILQDDKFFSRLLSRQASNGNASCRVYYGVAAGAVPFMWESQPGTPKTPISCAALPPLTPPPSYAKPRKTPSKKQSRSGLFMAAILPRFNLGRWGFSSRRGEGGVGESPTSAALCFDLGREGSGRLRGCYSMVFVKKALSSLAGFRGPSTG